MDWVSILGKVSIWIILLPLFIALIGVNKIKLDSRLILVVVLIGTIPQVLNPFLRNTSILTLLYNIYTPLEFVFYWILFKNKIRDRKFQAVFYGIFLLFGCISLYIISRNSLTDRFVTVWVVINNVFQLLMVCLCLLTYYYEDELDLNIFEPFFWYLLAITLYASCTVVFYSLWDYVKAQGGRTSVLNLIHHVFNIILYILFSVGLSLDIWLLNKRDNAK